jgi:hypothetical protein
VGTAEDARLRNELPAIAQIIANKSGDAFSCVSWPQRGIVR